MNKFNVDEVVLYKGTRHVVVNPSPPSDQDIGLGPHVQISALDRRAEPTGQPFVVPVSQVQEDTALARLAGIFKG